MLLSFRLAAIEFRAAQRLGCLHTQTGRLPSISEGSREEEEPRGAQLGAPAAARRLGAAARKTS